MGQTGSSLDRTGNKPSSKVKQRVQLLEELVQGPSVRRRQQLLKQLTADSSTGRSQSGYFLPTAPEEFKLGCLIAAGSYGRVYAGTYCGHPAALKLLILDEESAAAILNEVRLCLKLNHKNLVRLLDCAVVSTSRQLTSSQDELDTGWLGGSAGPQTLQPSQATTYNYLPVIGTQATAVGQQQTGTLQVPSSPTVAPGSNVIVRASQRQFGLLTGNDLLYHEVQQQRSLGLTNATGHACFEVWIAMELCDGGTLAKQVTDGFQYNPDTHQVDLEVLLTLAIDIARALAYMHAEHVCHGDLKSENVLLKSLGPSSFDGSLGCAGSTCWGSSDDCSWLSMLCSTASSTTCTHSCRRYSSDSCFSCCTKASGNGVASAPANAVSGGWFANCVGCSTASSSSSSSPVLGSRHGSSTRNSARNGSILSLSLAGLCCIAQPNVGIEERDDEGYQQTGGSSEAANCFCSSCRATPDGDDDASCLQARGSSTAAWSYVTGQQEEHVGCQGTCVPATAFENPFSPVDSGEVSCTLPGLGSSPHHHLQAVSGDPAAEQLALLSALQAGQAYRENWPHSGDAADAGEEEHIAPLSLYTTAREHRRSRRLSQTALTRSMQMAVAAAAARYNMPSLPADQTHVGRQSSSNSSNGSASALEDMEDVCSTGSGSEMLVQQQQPVPGSQTVLPMTSEVANAVGECSAAGSRQEATASHCSSDSPSPCSILAARVVAAPEPNSISGNMSSAVDGNPAAGEEQRFGRASSGLSTYAHKLPSRSRRHSYCYGANYASLSPLDLSGLAAGSISAAAAPITAAEAATAIAAAAEAAKAEWRAALPPRSDRRSRRMSCDDRLLLQRASTGSGLASGLMPAGLLLRTGSGHHNLSKSAFGVVSGLGRAPAVFRRVGGGITEQQKADPVSLAAARGGFAPAAAAGRQQQHSSSIASSSTAAAARCARRHSWTGLESALGDASGRLGFRSLKSLLLPQDHQQQQQAEEASTWLLGGATEQQELQEQGLLQQGSAQSLLSSKSGHFFSAYSAPSPTVTLAPSARSSRRRRMSAAPAVGMPLLDADVEENAAAVPCLPGLGRQGSGRRARRHSWAGFGYEQPAGSASGQSRRRAVRALSSCFAPEVDGQLLQDVMGSDSSQISNGSQTPRRSRLFQLAACCGDGSYVPLDDAAEAYNEVQQPLLQRSCNSTEPASDVGSGGCFPRRLLGSCMTQGSKRRSSWCAGPAAQDIGVDLSVVDRSSSMTALLPPASCMASTFSVPMLPCMSGCAGAGTAKLGRSGRRCSWDESRNCRSYNAAFLDAVPLDVSELKTLGVQERQWQPHHELPVIDSHELTCGLPVGSSQSSADMNHNSAPGAHISNNSSQHIETAAHKPERAASWDGRFHAPAPDGDSTPTTGQQQPMTQISTIQSPYTPRSAVQHAPSAAHAAAVSAGLGSTTPGQATQITPHNSVAALHPVTVASTLPSCSVVSPSATDAGSLVVEQPPVEFGMLFWQQASADAVHLAAAQDGASCSNAGSRGFAGLVAKPRGTSTDTEPETLPTGDTFRTWLSKAQHVQDVQIQQHQESQQSHQHEQQRQPPALAAAYAAVTSASQHMEPAELMSPVQPLVGSFGLKRPDSSRGNSSSVSAADMTLQPSSAQAAPEAAPSGQLSFVCTGDEMAPAGALSLASGHSGSSYSSSSANAGDRARRWSTGVAAHDLLRRKQSLLPSPCGQVIGNSDGPASNNPGSIAGSAISSVRRPVALTSPGQDGSVAASADLQPSDDIRPAAAGPADGSLARPGSIWGSHHVDSLGQPPKPSSTSGASGHASSNPGCSSQVVNVLGIPHRPSPVLAQRRLSYDTATGAYTVVDKYEPSRVEQHKLQQPELWPLSPPMVQLQQQPSDAATPQPQESPMPPALVQQNQQITEQQQQPSPCSPQELLQQQQFQAQMQRLVEALAKKGYSTSGESGSSPWTSTGLTSSLQHQQQQEGPGHHFLSSPAAAAASALQQPHMPSNDNAGCVPMSRRRYTAKVCDFGFSQCLRAGQSHCSTAAAGTITHQAPEVLRSGHLSPAADIYAFGIILWELLTGEQPFRGLLEGDLIFGVCERGLRPIFPPGAPAAYVALAQQCWAQDAADRPSAQQLLKRLNEMLYDVRRAKALQHNSSGHSDSSKCRRRRHSMPVVGSNNRKRRMSRRLSLFLPFSRQPAVVPEHAPLEQQLSAGATANVLPAAAAASTSAAAVHAMHVNNSRERSSLGGGSSGSSVHVSSVSGHAVRLRDLKNVAVTSTSGDAGVSHSTGVAHASEALHGEIAAAPGDANQWFQSFDD